MKQKYPILVEGNGFSSNNTATSSNNLDSSSLTSTAGLFDNHHQSLSALDAPNGTSSSRGKTAAYNGSSSHMSSSRLYDSNGDSKSATTTTAAAAGAAASDFSSYYESLRSNVMSILGGHVKSSGSSATCGAGSYITGKLIISQNDLGQLQSK